MSRFVKLVRSIASATNILNAAQIPKLINPISVRAISTTIPRHDLMEFFDDKKNWGENEVKVGRSWRLEELRIKSNEDLHKLWYVLLKERNMLFTMEQECKDKVRLFPSPERIDKVEESMKNLETVVRERNRAYHMLEIGEDGERPTSLRKNPLGLRYRYKHTEHLIPKFMNTKWRETHRFGYEGSAPVKFLKLYREKLYLEKKRQKGRNVGHVRSLLRMYKDLDMDALKRDYPDVDIEKEKLNRKSQGHFVRDD